MSYTLTHINWHNPKSKVTPNFTVHECLYLPTWDIYHEASDAERANLLSVCVLMERIRGHLGKPITVHCMLRPDKVNCPISAEHHGMDYNAAIGSKAKRSPHILGLACDFSLPGYTCDSVRAILLPLLEAWGFCMEDIPGANWVHVDLYHPRVHGGKRCFKP